eukprot:gnl/Ergobibamus_cyprinoides/1145.p2 GENE.gnl/Ergobibamus_cyprinoides/1145~~gnl/Ergobibamus_cyprinoides/1145.p2  ORF type:complete len:128 (+),score=68.67 gnl/Ergobibamus_cyprinoides/1145:614-997(+)
MAAHIPSVFMPHGLGHMIGLAVHDVAGFPKGFIRSTEPELKNLRLDRPLKEGFAVTVEPGCYINPVLIDAALAEPARAKYLNKERIYQLQDIVGGCRIEDDVIVTATGHRVLPAAVREVEEIEALRA